MRIRRSALTAVAAAALMAAAIGATSASGATYSNTTPVAFPQQGTASPYPSQITVAGHTAPISDLNVSFNGFTHPAPSDLQGPVLVGPGGQALLLMACVGGDGGPGAATDATLKIDDSSGIRLPVFPGAVTSGIYKPTNHCASTPSLPSPGPLTSYANPGPGAGGGATLASVFNGSSANGIWSLFVNDGFVGGGTGQFAGGWSLEISPDPVAKKKCKKGRKLKKGKCVKKKRKKKKKK